VSASLSHTADSGQGRSLGREGLVSGPSGWTDQPLHEIRPLVASIMLLIAVPLPGHHIYLVGVLLSLLRLSEIREAQRQSRFLRAWFAVSLLAIISSYVLSRISVQLDPGRGLSEKEFAASALMIFSLGWIPSVFFWAASRYGALQTARIFAISVALGALEVPPAYSSAQPWKFAYAWPVTLLVLSVLCRSKTTAFGVLVVLAVVSAEADYRSFIGFLAFTLLFLSVPHVLLATAVRRLIASILVTAALVALILTLGAGGSLGNQIAARQDSSASSSGSAFRSGRPEVGAALALARRDPWGYGGGVEPSIVDVDTAVTGLVSYAPGTSPTYAYLYLFAGRIELHSITSDLWAESGLVGLGMALAGLAFVLVEGVGRRHHDFRVSAVALFLASSSAWSLLFAPIGSAYIQLAGTVGFLAVAAKRNISEQ
jgi:hypothetical protein